MRLSACPDESPRESTRDELRLPSPNELSAWDGLTLPVASFGDESFDFIFFNGTVMRGEPEHGNLAGTEFIEEIRTAPGYRLFSIDDEYPAMVPRKDEGVVIEGELYRVPTELWPRILEAEPPGLVRDLIELIDGRVLYGIVGSDDLVAGKGRDISEFGGWRPYLRYLRSRKEI